MSKAELKHLLKHSGIYGFGTAIGQVIGFLLLPLYTRFLTPADYGLLSLIEITTGLIGIVVGIGISESLSRFYYDYHTEKERNVVITTAYGISALAICIAIPPCLISARYLSLYLFHTMEHQYIILIALISLLAGFHVDIGLTVLRIKAKSIIYVIISMINMVLLISLNIYFIAIAHLGIVGFFYSAIITRIANLFMLTIPILIRASLKFSPGLAAKMVTFSFPLIFSNIFRVMTNESDKYFINYFFSPFETGLYSISQKIGTSIHMLITLSFLQAYLPRRFEIMKNHDAGKTYASILEYYMLILCTIGLALSLFAPEVMRVMTTEKFYSAARYIPFVALSMIIFGMKYHFELGILIEKKTKYIAYINGVSSIINVFLNWLLIPGYGIWGAVVAINASYSIVTILNYLVSQRLYYINFDLFKVVKILLICCLIYLASILFVHESIIIDIVFKSSLLFAYVLLLLAAKVITREQLNALLRSAKAMISAEAS